MRLSELIMKLEELDGEVGDLEVLTSNPSRPLAEPIKVNAVIIDRDYWSSKPRSIHLVCWNDKEEK